MDDEPGEQISQLEVQIEELTDALERCRKTALASKAAMGLGGILMAAIILRVVTFDPMMMVAGLAALLGGIVVFGSNTSTANQLSEAMRSAESQRATLVDRLNICLVEDAPRKSGFLTERTTQSAGGRPSRTDRRPAGTENRPEGRRVLRLGCRPPPLRG